MRKKTLSIMLACAATMVMTTPAFAAGWQKDNDSVDAVVA